MVTRDGLKVLKLHSPTARAILRTLKTSLVLINPEMHSYYTYTKISGYERPTPIRRHIVNRNFHSGELIQKSSETPSVYRNLRRHCIKTFADTKSPDSCGRGLNNWQVGKK